MILRQLTDTTGAPCPGKDRQSRSGYLLLEVQIAVALFCLVLVAFTNHLVSTRAQIDQVESFQSRHLVLHLPFVPCQAGNLTASECSDQIEVISYKRINNGVALEIRLEKGS